MPQTKLFEEYIGPDVIKFFLPPISIDKEDEDNPEWLLEESMDQNHDDNDDDETKCLGK